jgi:hypothetical protein
VHVTEIGPPVSPLVLVPSIVVLLPSVVDVDVDVDVELPEVDVELELPEVVTSDVVVAALVEVDAPVEAAAEVEPVSSPGDGPGQPASANTTEDASNFADLIVMTSVSPARQGTQALNARIEARPRQSCAPCPAAISPSTILPTHMPIASPLTPMISRTPANARPGRWRAA